jgi:hypothetical protein
MAACIVAARKNRFSGDTASSQREILLKAIGAVILVALGGLPLSGPAFAQAKDKTANGSEPFRNHRDRYLSSFG